MGIRNIYTFFEKLCSDFAGRAFIIVMTVGTDNYRLQIRQRHVSDVEIAAKQDSIEFIRCDEATFSQLYREHYDGVFRYCTHRLFDRQTAEDVTATVFLKVVENLPRFRGGRKAFGFWLYKIATNTINSHLRKIVRQKKLLKDLADYRKATCDFDGDDPIDDQARKLAMLQHGLLSLKPRYQTVITLRFFENMKLVDIAEVLGSSPGTVRSQLTRGLVKLRKKMTALDKRTEPEVL